MRLKTRHIYYIHFIGSVAFFAPFFLFSQILVGNTDLSDSIASILFDQLRTVFAGDFPLWNEYQYSGVPYGVYPNAHYLNPENLLLFALFEERYFFSAATFLAFVKYYLTGLFAFFACIRIIKNRYWALFASLTYQFGIFTFWQLSLLDTFSLYFYLTVAIFLVFSVEQRGPWSNFLWTTLVLWQVMLPNHLVTVVYAVGLLGVFVLFRLFNERNLPVRMFFPPLGALVFIFIFFSFRLLFLIEDVAGSHREVPDRIEIHTVYDVLLLRFFNPELFNFTFRSSPVTIESIGSVFKRVHTHGVAPHFFGASTMILIVAGMFIPLKSSRRNWVLLAVLLCLAYFSTVFGDLVLQFAIQELNHPLGRAILLPFPICIAAGAVGAELFGRKRLEENAARNLATVVRFLIWSIVFASLALIGWRMQGVVGSWIRLGFYLLGGVLFCFALAYRRSTNVRALLAKLTPARPMIAMVTFAAIAVISLVSILLVPEPVSNHMRANAAVLTLLIVVIAAALFVFRSSLSNSVVFYFLGGSVVLFLLPLAYYPENLISSDEILSVSLLGILGLLRFVCVGQVYLYILRGGFTRGPRMVVVLLLAVHSFDLAVSLRIHSLLSTRPFWNYTTFLPPADDLISFPVRDLDRYRVSRANSMLGLPYLRELHGEKEISASSFQYYGMRSHLGYYNAISQRYLGLFQALSGRDHTVYGAPTGPPSVPERMVLGLKYDYIGSERVSVDSEVLPRFGFFENFLRAGNGRASRGLFQDHARGDLPRRIFDPMRQVVLEGNVSPRPRSEAPRNVRVRPLEYRQIDEQTILLRFRTASAGFVLFNDVFHPGWRARVNDRFRPVLHANHAFMAVAVPDGEVTLEFRYEPRALLVGKIILRRGLVFFAAVFGLFLVFKLVRWRIYQRRGTYAAPPSRTIRRQRNRTRHPRAIFVCMVLLGLVTFIHSLFNYRDGLHDSPRVIKVEPPPVPEGQARATIPPEN